MSEYDLTAWWAPFLAFAAGIVAFASPCVLPLVPGYLSFVTAAGDGRGSVPSPARRPNTLPIFLFVAGSRLSSRPSARSPACSCPSSARASVSGSPAWW
jgi:cytochrome c biogenesis protein CcdA